MEQGGISIISPPGITENSIGKPTKNIGLALRSNAGIRSAKEKLKAPWLKNLIKEEKSIYETIMVLLGEIIGTAILVFIGCLSCVGSMGIVPPLYQISMSFGIAVTIAIQCVGHISGAHINPSITVASLILGLKSLPMTGLYIFAQCLGGVFGYGLLKAITPSGMLHGGNPEDTISFCKTDLHQNISVFQGLLSEIIATGILVFFACGVWDPRNEKNSDSVPLRFGFCVTVLCFVFIPYTGCSLNPARSIAPAIWNGYWKNHWVFWIGPISGAIISSILYRCLFLLGYHYFYTYTHRMVKTRINSLHCRCHRIGTIYIYISPTLSLFLFERERERYTTWSDAIKFSTIVLVHKQADRRTVRLSSLFALLPSPFPFLFVFNSPLSISLTYSLTHSLFLFDTILRRLFLQSQCYSLHLSVSFSLSLSLSLYFLKCILIIFFLFCFARLNNLLHISYYWISFWFATKFIVSKISIMTSNNLRTDFRKLIQEEGSVKKTIITGLAEMMGTSILLFLGCMGCVSGLGVIPPHLQITLNFGLSVMIVIQCFGHISEAHVNPAITVGSVVLGKKTIPEALVYLLAQTLGAVSGYGMLRVVTPKENLTLGGLDDADKLCVTDLHPNVSAIQGLLIESLSTSVLMLVTCALWDSRNAKNTDSVPLKFGFTVATLATAFGPYTGCSMNPVRSLGPAIWNNQWNHHWIYWFGPIGGALLTSISYRMIFGVRHSMEEENIPERVALNSIDISQKTEIKEQP